MSLFSFQTSVLQRIKNKNDCRSLLQNTPTPAHRDPKEPGVSNTYLAAKLAAIISYAIKVA